MLPVDFHYPLGGMFLLAGFIVFLKGFDLLAHLSAKRLLEQAAVFPAGNN